MSEPAVAMATATGAAPIAAAEHAGQNFVEVTEVAGDEVSAEQVERIAHRYRWALGYCRGKDVLEAACGSGQGIGMLARAARSLVAGDYSEDLLAVARRHYGDRFSFRRFDAEDMPYDDGAFDVVILFEALYYLARPERFVEECRRVVRPGGAVLIACANRDLYDFNPSPHSHAAYGTVELRELFKDAGFIVQCFGHLRTDRLDLRQRLLRPAKRIAVSLGLMPRTMHGKKLLKRLVFGRLVAMPHELAEDDAPFAPPAPIPIDRPDRAHKVIYCVARLG